MYLGANVNHLLEFDGLASVTTQEVEQSAVDHELGDDVHWLH